MPRITLPDGSVRQFDAPVSGTEIAADIGSGLAKAALAIQVDGDLRDLAGVIEQDANVAIITRESEDALELLRHDAAHVLAEAVKELYPETQVTIGPAIENGFYYDFAREQPFTPEDLERIETRMREIVDRNETIVREEWDRDEAIRFFRDWGEEYKAEIIDSIPQGEVVSLYRQGDWIDLCRGPHLPSTGKLGKAFKLLRISGAYWRGNSDNEMLQRIYGTAWPSEKELKAYLHMLEEAQRRDHRRLGVEMDLYHFQEESPGAVFWHPGGQRLFQRLIRHIRERQEEAGYVEVDTPQIMDRSLWEASGHWEAFRENMFTSQTEDGRLFALKPMNCPGHVQIFKNGPVKSHRSLPLRIAEFGKVHRYEPSGALHGLMRVRAFTQDDAHVFCTDEQITQEATAMCDLILSVYRDCGFEDVRIKFADRPPLRVGTDDIWDKAEQALRIAIDSTGLRYTHNPGEGAFYGPKLEFVLRDAIGRDWQCGTVQVDFNLPQRLGASYVGEDGARHTPVMLHRAMLGSIERFTGILIEHFAGHLPLWLSPKHAVICTITSAADDWAREVQASFRARGLLAEIDLRNEKISYKVREHSKAKAPVILALGKQEADMGTVSMRRLGSKEQRVLTLDEAVDLLAAEVVGRVNP
ncbi:threonine--tRNA ligase [Thioalkalivibrio sp. HK1]|uniref:threonine--tRNA ligase n=1 Tax=Thioalkalivibrio sp. HK1 TaxID=1469245 RepID=UPI00047096BF|nr:threonine--tRNA ligase [Thioalkalivibrio sp. HK1]